LEGWLFSGRSEQSEVFKKPRLAGKKPALQKRHICFDHVNRLHVNQPLTPHFPSCGQGLCTMWSGLTKDMETESFCVEVVWQIHSIMVHMRRRLVCKGVARGAQVAWPSPSTPIEMLFQVFKLNFSWDVPKMHYFSNKFSKKCQALGALRPQRPTIFNFGELKLRNLAKLWFFKLFMTKSNFKNQSWRHVSDVIAITSQKNVTKITSQNFSILGSTK